MTPLRVLLVPIAALVMFTCTAHGQAVAGNVTTSAGKPLSGVYVFGGLFWYNVPQRKAGSTNADGRFVLRKQTTARVEQRSLPQKNFGYVLHFRRLDLKPLTVVLDGKSNLHVVMQESAATEWRLPYCQPSEGDRRIGEHFRFRVPKTIDIGKSEDVDYTVFHIKSPSGNSWLELWLGPTAGTMTAGEERLFLRARTFDERFVVVPSLGTAGIDGHGRQKDGTTWRWVGLNDSVLFNSPLPHGDADSFWPNAIANHMIRYSGASEAEAAFFDEIIDSACVQPPRSQIVSDKSQYHTRRQNGAAGCEMG